MYGCLTANPIAPMPNIATEDPGSTFAVFQAAPIPGKTMIKHVKNGLQLYSLKTS